MKILLFILPYQGHVIPTIGLLQEQIQGSPGNAGAVRILETCVRQFSRNDD